ncbi:hypothetical protein GCM10022278_40600 [Allohahella marinimesophila]|uniref:Uncharacterized protein n=1 Tax=Allohahella marinimesophila TaxID=1054972 RepID=A0ABP7QCH4_9GAMM
MGDKASDAVGQGDRAASVRDRLKEDVMLQYSGTPKGRIEQLRFKAHANVKDHQALVRANPQTHHKYW